MVLLCTMLYCVVLEWTMLLHISFRVIYRAWDRQLCELTLDFSFSSHSVYQFIGSAVLFFSVYIYMCVCACVGPQQSVDRQLGTAPLRLGAHWSWSHEPDSIHGVRRTAGITLLESDGIAVPEEKTGQAA